MRVQIDNEPEVQVTIGPVPATGPLKKIIETKSYSGDGLTEFTINAKTNESQLTIMPKPAPGQKPVKKWIDVTKSMVNFTLIRLLPINNTSNVLLEYQTEDESYNKFMLINAICEMNQL
jgi:hypothetical protein